MPARKTTAATTNSARTTKPRATAVAAPVAVKKSPRATTRHKKAEAAGSPQTASSESIAKLAYSYWEARGYQAGDPLEDWFRAERELSSAN